MTFKIESWIVAPDHNLGLTLDSFVDSYLDHNTGNILDSVADI